MAYSNGYDITAVHAALENRVGFRQPLGSGTPTLTTAVTTTNSGRYFQDFHTLVTVENIKATMEQKAAIDADLITYLQNLRKAVILRALNGVFTRQDIEQVKLFTRYGKNDQLITNTGLFVGYEINVADRADIAVQLDALHVMLDGAVTFNVYIFKDGNPTAIHTIAVTSVANQVTEVIPSTEKIIGRGKYYLGYFQDDLGSVQAYREQVSCLATTRVFRAEPMQADATGATTFDRENISYPSEPFGLNAEISAFTDHTAQAKRKAAMFDELIGLTMCYVVIEQIIYAVRSNATERFLKDQMDKIGMKLDLDGAVPITGSPQVMALKQRIERETESLSLAFYPKPKAQVVNQC